MMQSIQIRLATESDIDLMTDVGDRLFDYPIKPNRALEFFADPRHCLMLALASGELVGFASAFRYVHPDKDPGFFINEAAVLEPFQGQGIGRRLIAALVKHASSTGCVDVWVATEEGNQAARKAYRAAGGVEDPELAVVFTFDSRAD